jgi:hypothetical protein
LGATLRKVQWQQEQAGLSFNSIHPAVQHMLLVGNWNDWGDTQKILQTHPPIAERIKRIYGRTMPPLAEDAGTAPAAWKNPFAASQPLPFVTHSTTSQETRP